jgi:hypothetical protein
LRLFLKAAALLVQRDFPRKFVDQNIWTIISFIVGFLAAFVGGASGAILTNRYTRSQERRQKERDVIEEMYALAISVRRGIEPSLVAASASYTAIKSTWTDPMIRMTMLSDLYLPLLKSEVDEVSRRIQSVEDAFTHASYEQDNSGSVTKRIMPADFEQVAKTFKESITVLLATLQEHSKKRQ